MKHPDIIVKGEMNGEGMVIHHKTKKGTDIFGLGIPNIYGNADWDLGPTWCYIIDGQNTVLIDTGRFGNLEVFKTLLPSIDMELPDIEKVIITHSHEDHDGNLAEILTSSKADCGRILSTAG